MNFRIFNDSFHNFFLSTVTYRCVEIAQRLKDKIIIYSSLFKPLHEREGGGGGCGLAKTHTIDILFRSAF